MKSFLIVGMGSFGHHLCRALADQKCEVMVADQVSDTLEDLLPLVVSAIVSKDGMETGKLVDMLIPEAREALRTFTVEVSEAEDDI